MSQFEPLQHILIFRMPDRPGQLRAPTNVILNPSEEQIREVVAAYTNQEKFHTTVIGKIPMGFCPAIRDATNGDLGIIGKGIKFTLVGTNDEVTAWVAKLAQEPNAVKVDNLVRGDNIYSAITFDVPTYSNPYHSIPTSKYFLASCYPDHAKLEQLVAKKKPHKER